jgi:outer membrane lipoprotein carrier protein
MTTYTLNARSVAHVFLAAILLVTLTGFSGIALGSQENPADIGARLQARYNRLKSLTFDFSQHTRGQLTGRGGTGSGKAYFLKNGNQSKMLWNYTAPDKQVILSDGATLSMYFAKQKQMIVTPADALQQDLTYSFFSGAGDLENDFMVLQPDPEVGLTDTDKESFKLIKLVPRTPRSQVKNIHAWITSDSLIQRMEIHDYFDTITILNFTNIKVDGLAAENAQVLGALFSFSPPEGTEIIHQ